jgi:hypothetical protein
VILTDRKVSATYITKVAGQMYPGKISGPYQFLPKKDPRKKFRPENFWNFQISIQKFLGPANFQPEFFWDFQLSNRKKFPNYQIAGDRIVAGLRREC